MAYVDFTGTNGNIRVNYTETLNQSAGTSTITVTSVQLASTNWYGVTFLACGSVYVGSTRVLYMNGENGYSTGYVGETGTWYTVSNTSCSGVSVYNGGNGSTTTISIGPWGSYNDFNAWCLTSSSGNISCSASSRTISLSRYTTDSASSVSATSPVTLGNSTTISITRAKTSYTHTLQYSFDNSSWTNIATGVATSYSWSTSNVSAYFSTTTARTCYIRCLTYSGSTYIGANSTSIYITATGTPSITSITVTPVNDNAVIQGWNNGNIFVQGYSTMSITVNYSLPSGTTLSGCKIAVNGTTVSDSTSTTFSTTSAITESGTIGITATVTDSRGGTGSGNTTITVYPYSRPYASVADAIRYSTNVNTEDKQNGTNISAKATIAYSSVNGYNSAGVKVRYKAAGGTYPTSTTTLTSGNANYVKINGSTVLSTTTSYIVQFVIYDSLHTESSDPTTVEVIIPTRAVTLHAKDGGAGIALGGYNTLDAVELWLNTYLYGKLIVPSSMYGTSAPSTSGAVVGQVYFQLVD